jgi:putative oxidoreductase
MGKCQKYCDKYGEWAVLLARVLVGLMFFLHGYGKFAGGQAAGLMLLAAVIEVGAGAALFLGLYTRLAATLGALLMVAAYVKVHVAGGLNPLANGGELALMYLSAFLLFTKLGNGKWSLERKLMNKETY